MNYYNEIKNKLIDNEIYSKVKDYSKERHRVITYFEIGKLLYEAGSRYGDNIIDEYSKKLRVMMDNYQMKYGPLTNEFPCNKWRWLEEPWPWERGNY